MKISITLITVLSSLTIYFCTKDVFAFSHKSIYPKSYKVEHNDSNDVGEPLILTPLIKSGKIKEAKDLALVTNLTDVVSYSGYLTVNPKFNSNLWFWFFPAAFNPEKAPVIVWLQGGPGGSSLFGLFVENGPFIVDSSNNLLFRSTSWSLTHSVIYFDNPTGTGFSFTGDDAGYARTEEDVANDLYNALTQFFTLFPEYQPRDFYVTGESYAGKYIPAICYKIHTENNLSPTVKINLKGMAIGDGFSDPENMLDYGDYLYNVGLIDYNERLHFEKEQQRAKDFIQNEKWSDAFNVIDELMDGDLTPYPSYFKNSTGLDFYFNFLMASTPVEQNYYSSFVQQDYVRRSLHVGNITFNEGSKVENFLKDDMYKSVVNWIVAILDAKEKYQVLIYSGQLDIIVAHTLTDNSLRKMKWHGSSDFPTADRKLWRVGSDLAGYVKVTDNLTYLLIRDAGHMVPYDQPKWAFDMINRFTARKPFAY